MAQSKSKAAKQFAALPYRIADDGSREVMLLTSRGTGRWVIPKGNPIKGMKPREVAAREAFEEAGLVGQIGSKEPIGIYSYAKQFNGKPSVLCDVRVFLMAVGRQLDKWPEQHERDTRWFVASEAAELVDEGGLAELIRRLS